MSRRKFNKETIDLAVQMYVNNSPISYTDVGAKFGMTGGNVRHWVIKSGYKSRKNSISAFTDKQKEDAVLMYQDKSKSLKSIAKHFGVSTRSIFDWVRDKGVDTIRFEERRGYSEKLRNKAREIGVLSYW